MNITLYHVCIRFGGKEVLAPSLQPLFDSIGYWARMNVYNWYVWSRLTPAEIYNTLAPKFTTNDSIVVTEVKTETIQGWAPEWFWKFAREGWQNVT